MNIDSANVYFPQSEFSHKRTLVVYTIEIQLSPSSRIRQEGLLLEGPNSDQHQISPCNINAYSTPEVMRIKDVTTQGEFS